MTKCKYYTECTLNGGDGRTSTYGCCYGQKYAPRVYCNGDESKCECENNTESNYDLVSEIVFQVKITEKDNTVEKVYCKSREDAKSFINAVLEKRDLTRIKSIQITPIKNLYYRKR